MGSITVSPNPIILEQIADGRVRGPISLSNYTGFYVSFKWTARFKDGSIFELLTDDQGKNGWLPPGETIYGLLERTEGSDEEGKIEIRHLVSPLNDSEKCFQVPVKVLRATNNDTAAVAIAALNYFLKGDSDDDADDDYADDDSDDDNDDDNNDDDDNNGDDDDCQMTDCDKVGGTCTSLEIDLCFNQRTSRVAFVEASGDVVKILQELPKLSFEDFLLLSRMDNCEGPALANMLPSAEKRNEEVCPGLTREMRQALGLPPLKKGAGAAAPAARTPAGPDSAAHSKAKLTLTDDMRVHTQHSAVLMLQLFQSAGIFNLEDAGTKTVTISRKELLKIAKAGIFSESKSVFTEVFHEHLCDLRA